MNKVTKYIGLLFLLLVFTGCQTEQTSEENQISDITTFCNPMDLSYRFQLDEPSRREAADPTLVQFKDHYYLFASKSGGYWVSSDLAKWDFIETDEIPTEEYAPTAIGMGDTLYFLGSSTEASFVYQSTDPLNGKWTKREKALEMPVWDPAFFVDDDNKLYLYWGCSDVEPLYGVEVDYQNDFAFVGKPTVLKHQNPQQFGWEVPGDYNEKTDRNPWIEGPWVNKHNGKYYLQYSGPGTEFKSYSDAVYVSDAPLGSFKPQAHNPFAYKPEGFAAGAGHGSTYQDEFGNYWHIGTMTISQKHIFERRLGVFPTFFDKNGILHSVTKYGDYPLILPQKKIESFDDVFPKWMLLSYKKAVTVSSEMDSLPSNHLNDENIRTYWAAQNGDDAAFAQMDLGEIYDVYALQINFAEHETNIFGREKGLAHQYLLEYSNDNENWETLIDKSENDQDNTHIYHQLAKPISFRYIRITNKGVPSGHFAISGFRVFGKGNGKLPTAVKELKATRNAENRRQVQLSWTPSDNATGYVISYGIKNGQSPTKFYQHYMVYGDTSLTINSLSTEQTYEFTIEVFNENGIVISEKHQNPK